MVNSSNEAAKYTKEGGPNALDFRGEQNSYTGGYSEDCDR
jgi:hypothetical protein